MAFSFTVHIFFLLSLVGHSLSGVLASPPGCATCDPQTLWTWVNVASVFGILFGLLQLMALPCLAARVRSEVGLLLLLLPGILGLCGLNYRYRGERGENADQQCVVRRSLWGVLFALSFACLLMQSVRLHRLARGARSLGSGLLVGLAVLLAIVDPEWIMLAVVPRDWSACQFHPLELAGTSTYLLALLAMALVGAVCSLRGGQPQWRRNSMWLIATCITSALLYATWLTFQLYGNAALSLSSTSGDLLQAIVLLVQAWLLLVLYVPHEIYIILQDAPPTEAWLEEGSELNDINPAFSRSQYNDSMGTEFISPF